MKYELGKKQVQVKIGEFFLQDDFSSGDLKKIKKLAMKYKVRLGTYRKLYCRTCLNKLSGKTRISKTHKIIICCKCNSINRIKM